MIKHTPELNLDMQRLIAAELKLNGVHLDKFGWLSSDVVLREIATAIVPETHEGKIAPFGVIFADDATELFGVERVALSSGDLAFARKFADGMHCFLLFEKGQFYGLAYFNEPLTTELQFVRSFPASGGMMIQRSATGVTKFYQGDTIILHENRIWFTKPHVKEAVWKVSQCVAGVNRVVLNRILELSFHLLSPTSRVGAILVWCLDDEWKSAPKGVTEGHDLTRFDLSILDETRAATICHLLAQVDGATFLDANGKLLRTGVHLKYSDRSRDLVPELRGTRHTSAQRFSYDLESVVVITISEDGPVTVFSDGANIANLRINLAHKEARILKAAIPEKREEISSKSFEKLCDQCGKTSMIEQVNVSGWKGEKHVSCPVCQAPLHSASCFTLECRPFKRAPQNLAGTG